MAKKVHNSRVWSVLDVILIVVGGMGLYSEGPGILAGTADAPTVLVSMASVALGAVMFWYFRRPGEIDIDKI